MSWSSPSAEVTSRPLANSRCASRTRVAQRTQKLNAKITPASLCSSDRERRLWIWTLAVVVAIYASLAFAGRLADVLRARDLLGAALVTAFFVMLVAMAGLALKRRPAGREIWVVLGVVAVYAMALGRIGIAEERGHLFEYGLVAVLVYQALSERVRGGRRVRAPAALAVVATALLGWLDEGIQLLLPNRVYDIRDVGFNALAALMAVLGSLALAWAREARWKRGSG